MDLSRFFPPSILDQSFGLFINPEDLIYPSYNFHRTSYYRPWKWYMQSAEKDFGSTIQNEKESFKIALDVQHFQPEEINVKVAERDIIIEGKHEERQDNHGFISRQFKRRYFLPHDCDINTVCSSLSSDGVLTITANKVRETKNREIVVPITMCDSCPNKSQTVSKDQTIEYLKNIDEKINIETKEEIGKGLKKNNIEKEQIVEGSKKINTEKEQIAEGSKNIKIEKEQIAEGSKKINTEKEQMAEGLTKINTDKVKIERKELVIEDFKKADSETSKKGMELMLKEDHCCLLRPELLGAPSGIGNIQTLQVVDDVLKTSMETCAQQAASMIITEKINSASSQASEKSEKSVTCGSTSTQISETLASGLTAAGKTAVACGLTSAGITEKLCGITSTEITETSGMASKEKMEKAETLLCGLSSGGKTTEIAESLFCGLSSTGKSEQTEEVACGITSEVLTEKAETSTSTKTEMCNITSMLNETIQIQESSSSYSSSMAASIKETSEKISEIVSDISAQLKEAAENI